LRVWVKSGAALWFLTGVIQLESDVQYRHTSLSIIGNGVGGSHGA
jgi:hypothetical protein